MASRREELFHVLAVLQASQGVLAGDAKGGSHRLTWQEIWRDVRGVEEFHELLRAHFTHFIDLRGPGPRIRATRSCRKLSSMSDIAITTPTCCSTTVRRSRVGGVHDSWAPVAPTRAVAFAGQVASVASVED